MPTNWLSRFIGNGAHNNRTNNKQDSLFKLPLYPPPPNFQGKINLAARQFSESINHASDNFSVAAAQKQLTTVSEEEWISRGEQRALALFHAAAQHVPAYKDFLKKNKINASKVHSIEDFKHLPVIDKENYLKHYPLDQLTWHGNLASAQMISVSSGSSGEPFFWPRGQILDAETAMEHELFLTSSFQLDQHSTLFLVCFAMGMYVAGPITMNSVLRLGIKGYPVTLATPGYSPDDVLNIIPELASQYDQLVIAGYPPYVKELIDLGIDRNIKWEKIRLRFLLAGEGFNESWRTYIAKLAGDQSPTEDFINVYGSADAAVLAHETPASIIIRRRVAEDIEVRRNLFASDREPSLMQYHPEHKYFESQDGELIFTAPGGIPLIRYNIHDSGGLLRYQDIIEKVPGIEEFCSELDAQGRLWHLPYIYIYGKSDQTVILYGANIYPENIRHALEDEDLRDKFTGKFVMYTDLDHNQDQRLHIDIECSNGTRASKYLGQSISELLLQTLLELNSEYRVVHTGIGQRTVPIVRLIDFEDARFHARHIKHSWKRKDQKG